MFGGYSVLPMIDVDRVLELGDRVSGLLGEQASAAMAGVDLDQRRVGRAAPILGERAARGEPAASGRIGHIRRESRQRGRVRRG